MHAIATSVLDLLTADRYTGAAGAVRAGTLAALCLTVQRDLEALLNTRREEQLVPASCKESLASLLNFGLPDFSGYCLRVSSEQHKLRKAIESAIRIFEPRLTAVSVILAGWDESKPILRYRVEAVLRANPIPEPVVFDTELRIDSGRFAMRGRPR